MRESRLAEDLVDRVGSRIADEVEKVAAGRQSDCDQAARDIIALCCAPPPQPTQEGGWRPDAEELAKFLHDEIDLPDKFVGRQWPLHDDDDGYRGDGGYVKLQPKDVVEHYRDAAKRLAIFIAKAAPQPKEGR